MLMSVVVTVIIIICAAAALLLLSLFLISFAIYRRAFLHRCDKNPLLKYFTAEDFSLPTKQVKIDGKPTLFGFLYGEGEKLVIFCHGMGSGHQAYTTEIARLCREGYSVLAVDYAGCDMSGGKYIGGFGNGTKSVVRAIDYAQTVLRPQKIYLAGHSWGGYSALCATRFKKVAAAVAIGAPAKPAKCLSLISSRYITAPFAFILRPFFAFWAFVFCGRYGALNAARCIEKSNVPALIVQGENDPTVTNSVSAYSRASGKNVKKMLCAGKGHNPYNTEAAESKLKELSEALAKYPSGEVGQKFFENFDFSAATEEDEGVMRAIAQFLSQN